MNAIIKTHRVKIPEFVANNFVAIQMESDGHVVISYLHPLPETVIKDEV